MKKESPVEKFPGYVVLPEFLILPQVRAFEEALGDINGLRKDGEERVWISAISEKRLPVILSCVLEWHIKGIDEKPELDTFPMTPVVPANELVSWLFDEVRNIWMGEIADPKN